jgi:hypothetical protein
MNIILTMVLYSLFKEKPFKNLKTVYKDKIVYVEKPIEKIIYKDKIVEKIVYRNKPYGKTKNITLDLSKNNYNQILLTNRLCKSILSNFKLSN